ncbi:hypothetical protein IT412_00755 [Candidatus Peregrinibacteria bacterium]|nr:hypothetical protein [Candidatus Peregrinibacteria bacterium]
MAEDNLINSGDQADQIVPPATSTSIGSGNSVAGNNASASTGNAKKPKTEQQKAKERERRKRRRRKKKTVPQFVPGQDVATIQIKEPAEANLPIPENVAPEQNISPGAEEILNSAVDAPLILSEKDEDKEIRDATLANARPFDENEVNPADSAGMPPESKIMPEGPTNAELTNLGYDNNLYSRGEPLPPDLNPPVFEEQSPVEPVDEPLIETEKEPFLPIEEPVSNLATTPSESITPPESISPEPEIIQPLDRDQQIFEEEPMYVSTPIPEVHEEHFETENQKKARELSENLLKEEETLDELPVKQGILGKIFDRVVDFINGRKKLKEAKNSPSDKPKINFDFSKLLGFLKYIGAIMIVLILAIGAFWIGSSLKILENIGGWFTPKPGQEMVIGDNSKVIIDANAQRKWGFFAAVRFGENMGDKRDLGFNVFFNANYFGKLKDPVFYGETGISASIYYGFGKDDLYQKNRFIYYVSYLRRIVFANQVKVADVLNNKQRRDVALDDYTSQIKELFESGNKLRKEINVQIDEFKIAFNSLNGEKDRYETDFFASLSETEGEKADLLLQKFIETSQKQIEVKAKLAALTQLSQNYETLLIKLKLRIEAIEKNRDALISGVTVEDIPGSDIDLTRN